MYKTVSTVKGSLRCDKLRLEKNFEPKVGFTHQEFIPNLFYTDCTIQTNEQHTQDLKTKVNKDHISWMSDLFHFNLLYTET